MLKSVAVGAAALAIVGSSIVYAQQRSSGPDGVGAGGFGHGLRLMAHYRPSIDDMKAFTDARIAALKAGLQLTPEQDKNWPPFEQALRDLATLRIEHMQARLAREQTPAPQTPPAPPAPFERLAKRADAMAKRSAALKHLAETGAPLYQSLSDAQKARFKILAHAVRPHHRHFAWRDSEGGWRDDRGEGHDGGWRGRWSGRGEQGPDGPMHHMMGRDDEGSEL